MAIGGYVINRLDRWIAGKEEQYRAQTMGSREFGRVWFEEHKEEMKVAIKGIPHQLDQYVL